MAAKTNASRIQVKRAYEPPEKNDGVRVLVDRLWTRGVSKAGASLDAWMKELGPSAELRTWFGHRPARWDAFVDKYNAELKTPLRQMLLAELLGLAGRSTVTLIYGTHDTKQNEAIVMHDYLLREQPHPDSKWDAPTKLLVTADVVAAANHDAVARTSALNLFATSILTAKEIESTLAELVESGKLSRASDGLRVTARGRKEVGQHVA